MQRISHSSSSGFTLIETLVATGVLVTALIGIAQLLALSVRSTRDAGTQGGALLAAQDKVEALRSLPFAYGPLGAPVTDPGLASSGGLSLATDTEGYVDYLDVQGAAVDVNDEAHGAVFTRRWRVLPLDRFVPEALALEVCVFFWPAEGLVPSQAEACVATVRARQP